MSDMPERIWHKEFDIESGESVKAEYVRSALVPAWRDKPTCEGWWLRDNGEADNIVFQDDHLVIRVTGNWHEEISVGRWYGPIPEDKE